MKKFYCFSLSIIILAILFSFTIQETAYAQKLIVKLGQPPVGQFKQADLWNATIINNSNETYRIYLYGTLTEKKAGLIATGTTTDFDVVKGTKQIKGSDFPQTPDITYPNPDPKYKEALIRTGSLPPGDYYYCLYAKLKKNNEELGNDCIDVIIEDMGMISLLTPGNEEKINTKAPLFFTWMSTKLPKDATFTLKIVELDEKQNPESAIEKNRAWFEQSDIRNTTKFQYPSNAPQFKKGKRYAWQIISGNNKSEVFVLDNEPTFSITIDTLIVNCTDTSNVYIFTLNVTNNNPVDVNMTVLEISSTVPVTSTHNIVPIPAITNPILINETRTINGLIYTNIPITQVKIHVYWQQTGGGDDANKYREFPVPPCGCCDNFTRKIDSLYIGTSADSLGNGLHAVITAGPNPITKVVAEMVYFSYLPDGINGNYDGPCRRCVWGSEQFGNFKNPSSLAGMPGVLTTTPPFNYSREIIWQSPTPNGVNMMTGSPLSVSLLLPPTNSLVNCCQDTIRLCVRISFTDTACVTCDTVVCGWFLRSGNDIINMGYLDKMFDYFNQLKLEAAGNKNEKGEIQNAENINKEIKNTDEDLEKNSINKTNLLPRDTIYKYNMLEWNEFKEDEVRKMYLQSKELDEVPIEEYIEFMRNEYKRIQDWKKYYKTGPQIINSPTGCDNGGFENPYNNGIDNCEAEIALSYNGLNIIDVMNDGPSGTEIVYTPVTPPNVPQPDPPSCPTHLIQLVSSGTDSYGLSRTHSGNQAVQLGNTCVWYGLDKISKTFTVTTNNSNYSFWFALVLQEGNHNYIPDRLLGQNPCFIVRVKDASGNIIKNSSTGIPIQPTGFPVIADMYNSINGNNFIFNVPPVPPGYAPICVLPWTCSQLDLSAYIGNVVTVDFIAADCMKRGHWMYAYIDDICTPCFPGGESGSIQLTTVSSPCNNLPIQVCGNYIAPSYLPPIVVSNLTINLKLFHNGQQVGSTSTITPGSTNFCFTLNSSDFPTVTSPNDGYDFVAYLEYDLTVSGSTSHKVVESSTPGNGIIGGSNNDYLVICPTTTTTCCEDDTIKVVSDTSSKNGRYYINSNITTGPNRITKVRANLVNFYMNKTKDCERCVNSNIQFGSIIPVSPTMVSNSEIDWNGTSISPVNTKPPTTPWSYNGSFRELVWDKNGEARPKFNNENLRFEIKIPNRINLTCCPDTIQFCIRWSFTDTTCLTCDTLICYTIIRPGGPTPLLQIQNQELKDLEIEEKEMQQQYEKDMKELDQIKKQVKRKGVGELRQINPIKTTTASQGQSAGVINFELEKPSNVKVTIYDLEGKKVSKLYDDYIKEGKYYLDLNSSSIPDGIYFYRLENGGKQEYKKILVMKPVSSCNCGKR